MLIDRLANNDRTRWDFFFEMPVIEFLNTISFYIIADRNKKG